MYITNIQGTLDHDIVISPSELTLSFLPENWAPKKEGRPWRSLGVGV